MRTALSTLMLAFEFSLGAALGYSWERMLSDYNMAEGGFMVIGMLFMLIASALAAKVPGFGQHPMNSNVEGHLP